MDFSSAAERERIRNIIELRRQLAHMREKASICKWRIRVWSVKRFIMPWRWKHAKEVIADARGALELWKGGIDVLKNTEGVSV